MIIISKTPFRAINFQYTQVGGRRLTKCEIIEDSGVIAQGVAFCHPNDNFNKEIGRKTSLRAAVSEMDRETRADIWFAYHNRTADQSVVV